jgi:hypothetical protein
MEWILRRRLSPGEALLKRFGREIGEGSTPTRGWGEIMTDSRLGGRASSVRQSPDTIDTVEGVHGRGTGGRLVLSICSTNVAWPITRLGKRGSRCPH